MKVQKKIGKEAVELLQDTLYGDFLIKFVDCDFAEHMITMIVVLPRPVNMETKRYREEQYIVRFTNVSNVKLKKDKADVSWKDGVWWGEIAYIPEEKEPLHITKEERREYDYLIDASFFVLFIKGNLEVEPYEEGQSFPESKT